VTLSGHNEALIQAAFSRDGSRIITASADGTARVWDSKTGASMQILSGHRAEVRGAQLYGDIAATASFDETIKLWDATTGKQQRTIKDLDKVWDVRFSPRGNRLVTASRIGVARIWDAKTGSKLAETKPLYASVFSAAFNADGTRVVTASQDKTVRIWDGETGAELERFSGHGDDVWEAVFSPNGKSVISASSDGTARIWQVNQVALISGDERASFVCHNRLIGVQSFTLSEMDDSVLQGREDLRNPCDRIGPFSLQYYLQRAATIGSIIGEKTRQLRGAINPDQR
jgi:WD40 repeat protein